MGKHIWIYEVASLIPNGAIVSISSLIGLGCPDEILKAIVDRFDASGHPLDLTTFSPH